MPRFTASRPGHVSAIRRRGDQAWKIRVRETSDGDANEADIEFHEPVNGSAEMWAEVGGERTLGVTLPSMGVSYALGAERIFWDVRGDPEGRASAAL